MGVLGTPSNVYVNDLSNVSEAQCQKCEENEVMEYLSVILEYVGSPWFGKIWIVREG